MYDFGHTMSYLEEFKLLVESQNYSRLLTLWEEYCQTDSVDAVELTKILSLFNNSLFAPIFGRYTETVLPLWKQIKNPEESADVLRLILDLQTTNSPLFAELASSYLKERYGSLGQFSEFMRIIGLRGKQQFQGAISNFELLLHMKKGNFVFHKGGWGVGEILEFSLLREHALIEFEGFSTPKEVSFKNAFLNLIPLSSDHFLARRFGNPDILEKGGLEDPLSLIHLLLKDLGPKNAAELKEELFGLVISEDKWAKWWQQARAKIKKDTKIKSPQKARESFDLRMEEVSHDKQFQTALKKTKNTEELIETVYHYLRDFPAVLKNAELTTQLKERLEESRGQEEAVPEYNLAHKIELSFLLEEIAPKEYADLASFSVKTVENLEGVINQIQIQSFKKKALALVRAQRKEWASIFLHLLFTIPQNALKDYLFKELNSHEPSRELLQRKIKDLLHKVTIFPETFFWYFQKILTAEDIPLSDPESRQQFLEAYLILLHYLEHNADYRDLVKKMHALLKAKRYNVIRMIIGGASLSYLQEFLLLSSKCYIFTKQDRRILRSLAEVVQPSLKAKKTEERQNVIWTTQEGYQKVQERYRQIGTVEVLDNAREIEAARAHGDLRENAEYKTAMERRAHLQSELKILSRQISKAQIFTKEDVVTDEVGVGTIVSLSNSNGEISSYTLLGPWDADPEKNILSFQSKFAQAMLGNKAGDSFEFQGKKYIVQDIKSFL